MGTDERGFPVLPVDPTFALSIPFIMNEAIRALEPAALWNHFADLNAVPRPSKKEERVIAFIKKFGEDLGLPTQVDHAGNVIIKKPGTKGKEQATTKYSVALIGPSFRSTVE